MNGSWLEDDFRGPSVTAVEESVPGTARAALTVRVGPVFGEQGREKRPGVWVSYQPEYMNSLPSGPVLMSLDTWNELTRAVYRRQVRWMPAWKQALVRVFMPWRVW